MQWSYQVIVLCNCIPVFIVAVFRLGREARKGEREERKGVEGEGREWLRHA